MSTDPTVLIVGAGPTGLTAALVLARSGVPCRIIDERPAASSSSRALGLQARSMEVLAGLGVTDQIEAASSTLSGSSILRGRRTVVRLDWIPPSSRFPHTYVLPQAGLEVILREHLEREGIEIERGVELLSAQEGTGPEGEPAVRVRLSHDPRADTPIATAETTGTTQPSETAAFSWLIGADGARSTVRTTAGIGFPERDTGETYQLADAILELPLDLGDAAMWLGPQGPAMLMRLPGAQELWRAFIDVTDQTGPADPAALDADALTELLEERGPGGITVRELRWTSVFRTRIGLADSFRRGRILLAGDAAHVFPPFGGQGMNLGIQDAVAAAWRIASIGRGGDPEMLTSYEVERRPVAERVIADVEARRRLFALRHPLTRAGRDLLLALGGRSRRAARSASAQNSQLTISYADRTPGGDHGPRPRPGDRAPHADLGGTTTHELFGPDHATLLLFEGAGAREGTGPQTSLPSMSSLPRSPQLTVVRVPARSGSSAEARSRYGVGPEEQAWVLVRPDGHVAARGTDPAAAGPAISALTGA